MKLMARMAAVAALAAGLLAAAVQAHDEVTLEGKVVCAKCVLKAKGFTECQNVLVVSREQGREAKEDVQYYITNNDVGVKFGEVCMEAKKAKVTGTVADKDGRKWVTPSKMEPIS
jgi:hypothetical protein